MYPLCLCALDLTDFPLECDAMYNDFKYRTQTGTLDVRDKSYLDGCRLQHVLPQAVHQRIWQFH